MTNTNNKIQIIFPSDFNINSTCTTYYGSLHPNTNVDNRQVANINWDNIKFTFQPHVPLSSSKGLSKIYESFQQNKHNEPFQIIINQLHTNGEIIRQCVVHVIEIAAMDFGESSYEYGIMVESITVIPAKCETICH